MLTKESAIEGMKRNFSGIVFALEYPEKFYKNGLLLEEKKKQLSKLIYSLVCAYGEEKLDSRMFDPYEETA